ncbi:MAG: benzoyl-CoA 2,3-epoxidase subunit BoxB [Alphaproteobacteria bacterium]|nr:benzoyl-CoA 2,3-epoxidase subunit BoxB [Alphaproteobacteria bacterium]MCB9695399.1 benzoyl-CoA 2,3-epoxidase subunit BoxB [Alphaproteobacteria bacterium]
MAAIDLESRIPNNVDLSSDKRLQRALEKWQPDYLSWWQEMGPVGHQADDVYLRTAISVEAGGWANFGYVKMPDYRWGIFLSKQEEDRRIAMGDHKGRPVWQEVPGEHRATLRRLIVTQGDTEPASVEQQRHLADTAPSLYDMRNLFQVNVEEGRHLWQMVYLLHAFFGREGREEAEAMLERRSGDADKPRILDAFNQKCEDWLSFFCFTMFTDRDGKFQLAALAESGFDPLARSCRFMLTEEAHHLFVGDTGVDRVVRRSAQLTKESKNGLASELGGVDLEVLQKYVNYWFSYCLDLFGSEVSSNASEAFAAGLKGRFQEEKRTDDHVLLDAFKTIPVMEDGKLVDKTFPMRQVLNEVLREDYRDDCAKSVARWNKTLASEGLDFQLKLPSTRFHRRQGLYAGAHFDPEGNPVDDAVWEAKRDTWLPTAENDAFLRRIMGQVLEPGKMANWIAPPRRGIDDKAEDFEYVRFH